MTMGPAKTPSGAECDRIAPDVRARAPLAVAIRRESAAPAFEASGLQQHRSRTPDLVQACPTCRSPEFGLAGERPPFIFSARWSPMEEGDERLRSVLPGRQGRRSLRRALDAACAARIIVRQHAFQRSSPRRSADVAKLAQPAIEAARADWGGRAQARAARAAISPHPGGAGIRADCPSIGGMGPALVPLPVRAR